MSKELKEIYGAERVLKIKTFLEMIVYTDELSKINLEYLMDNAEVLLYAIEQAERLQELEKENKRLEDFIETIQNVHFVELQREKAENRRYREVINNINEKAMLYGVDEQVFEAIKEAIRVLEESK